MAAKKKPDSITSLRKTLLLQAAELNSVMSENATLRAKLDSALRENRLLVWDTGDLRPMLRDARSNAEYLRAENKRITNRYKELRDKIDREANARFGAKTFARVRGFFKRFI